MKKTKHIRAWLNKNLNPNPNAMTIDQYKSKNKQAKDEYEKSLFRNQQEYAFANNPYKIGDVFTDSIGSIVITSIKAKVILGSLLPMCVYTGDCCNKKGLAFKNGKKRDAFQSNELSKTQTNEK